MPCIRVGRVRERENGVISAQGLSFETVVRDPNDRSSGAAELFAHFFVDRNDNLILLQGGARDVPPPPSSVNVGPAELGVTLFKFNRTLKIS